MDYNKMAIDITAGIKGIFMVDSWEQSMNSIRLCE